MSIWCCAGVRVCCVRVLCVVRGCVFVCVVCVACVVVCVSVCARVLLCVCLWLCGRKRLRVGVARALCAARCMNCVCDVGGVRVVCVVCPWCRV